MPEAPDLHKILFANLIMMLSSSAMQQLGKLVNPMTKKTEVSLEGARMTIDMIEMLKEKTKGNLDEEENRMVREILSNLQMNYVETSENPPAESSDKEKKDAPKEEEPKAQDDKKKDSKS